MAGHFSVNATYPSKNERMGAGMKVFVIAALAASAPLGAVVGLLLKLDARDRGWSDRSAALFALVGAVACALGMCALVVYFGAYKSDPS